MSKPKWTGWSGMPALAGSCLALAATGPAAAQAGGKLGLTLRPDKIEHDGTTYDVERGSFRVPMYRADPESQLITLRFIRYRSAAPDPGPPVVFLAGGPGGSGISSMTLGRARTFLALLDAHDFVAFDQRGTGVSEPGGLEFDPGVGLPLDEPGDPQRSCAVARDVARHMLATMRERGIDVRGLTTAESADDLAALGRALGTEKMFLWGSSYGTHLALATARRHPERVAGLVLAGTEGPDHTFKLPSNIEVNLERVAELLKQDPIYAERMPDLLGTLQQVLDDLERNPRQVTLLPGVTVTVGKWDLQKALSTPMGSRSGLEQMPARVYQMSHGEFFELAGFALGFRQPRARSAMSIVMDCSSYATAERLERIEREGAETILGATIDFPYPCLCDAEGMPRLGEDFRGPLASDVPALFISGTLDGRTPVTNAEEIAQGFPAAQHLVIRGASHGGDLFTSSPLVLEAVRTFLRGETIAVATIEGPPWVFAPPYERSLAHDVLTWITTDGYEAAARKYQAARAEHEGRAVYDFAERVLNELGYELMQIGMGELAVDVFRLNTVAWPEALNAWDSLGESYARLDRVAEAIESYERSLELNPDSDNGRQMLELLREQLEAAGGA